MANEEKTGVEDVQAAAANTGVDESQAAAGADSEDESLDENTLFEQESEEPEEVTLAELLADDETEKVENSGDDNPPKNQEADKPEEQKAEAEPQKQQADIADSKAFSMRLKAAVQKAEQKKEAEIRKEYEAKNAETLEDRIVGRAHKIMDEFPNDKISLEYAKRLAKQEIMSETAAVSETQSEPADDVEAKKQAWLKQVKDEEPMLKIATGDPNITVDSYRKKDPVFNKILLTGFGTSDAYLLTKEIRGLIQTEIDDAKAAGGQEVIDQIKGSNSKAAAPVKPAKSGKHRSAIDIINNTPIEQLNALLENGPVRIDTV